MRKAILSDRFKAVGEVAVDDRNRISLTKALELMKGLFHDAEGLRFLVQVNEAGQLLLSPVVSVPLYEAWLYKNPVALEKVARGLSQVGESELHADNPAPQTDRPELKDLGSFEKYADDEIE
jgi:hypothetical protein